MEQAFSYVGQIYADKLDQEKTQQLLSKYYDLFIDVFLYQGELQVAKHYLELQSKLFQNDFSREKIEIFDRGEAFLMDIHNIESLQGTYRLESIFSVVMKLFVKNPGQDYFEFLMHSMSQPDLEKNLAHLLSENLVQHLIYYAVMNEQENAKKICDIIIESHPLHREALFWKKIIEQSQDASPENKIFWQVYACQQLKGDAEAIEFLVKMAGAELICQRLLEQVSQYQHVENKEEAALKVQELVSTAKIKLEEDRVPEWFKQLQTQLASGHYEEADQTLLNHLREAPDYEDAFKKLESLLARQPENTALLILKADLNYFTGNYQEAIKILTLFPTHPFALGRLGIVMAASGDYSAAIESFNQSLSMLPDPNMLYQRGQAYLNLGLDQAAKQDLAQARRVYPDFPDYVKPERKEASINDVLSMLILSERYSRDSKIILLNQLLLAFKDKPTDESYSAITSLAKQLCSNSFAFCNMDLLMHVVMYGYVNGKEHRLVEEVMNLALNFSPQSSVLAFWHAVITNKAGLEFERQFLSLVLQDKESFIEKIRLIRSHTQWTEEEKAHLPNMLKIIYAVGKYKFTDVNLLKKFSIKINPPNLGKYKKVDKSDAPEIFLYTSQYYNLMSCASYLICLNEDKTPLARSLARQCAEMYLGNSQFAGHSARFFPAAAKTEASLVIAATK